MWRLLGTNFLWVPWTRLRKPYWYEIFYDFHMANCWNNNFSSDFWPLCVYYPLLTENFNQHKHNLRQKNVCLLLYHLSQLTQNVTFATHLDEQNMCTQSDKTISKSLWTSTSKLMIPRNPAELNSIEDLGCSKSTLVSSDIFLIFN